MKKDRILNYTLSLRVMSDDKLSHEYMDIMSDKKNEIEKLQIKHEMAKRFFTRWAMKK